MRAYSEELRNLISLGRAVFYQTAEITFADGRTLELTRRDFYMDGNDFGAGAGQSAFPLGVAISKTINITLVNDDERFSNYDFYMAKIKVWCKCDLSETVESFYIGEYTVVTPEVYGESVEISAVDDMYKADVVYEPKVASNPTLQELLVDSCNQIDIVPLTSSFNYHNYHVAELPDSITIRELWGYIAQIAGGNAILDEYNRLIIQTWEKPHSLDGGRFDLNTPYETGDFADGGTFAYDDGDNYDGGDFFGNYHVFYKIKSPRVDTDDVIITGISTTIDQKRYLAGADGYVLDINNPLIEKDPETALRGIANELVGLKFRVFDIDHVAYPFIEFGDYCYVTDRNGNTYLSYVTDYTFTYFGNTKIQCKAQSPLRNRSQYASKSAKEVIATRREVKKEISSYDKAIQRLTSLMANSFGVFKSEEVLEDGSTIFYMHNKPELSNSSTIWKMTGDTFTVSTDGGQTWNAGFDSEGNAVFNILTAIGINADWINAGTITSRRINNGDGAFTVDEDGNVQASKMNITGGSINISKPSGVSYMNISDTAGDKFSIASNQLLYYYANSLLASLHVDSDGSGNIQGSLNVWNRSGRGSWFAPTSVYSGGELGCSGTKNRVIDTDNYDARLMYSYETPSPMFGDLGESELDEEGECWIDIDDVFGETIDTEVNYQVFLQKYGEGDCWVEERTPTYFVVKGTPELAFGWELKAIQKDYDTVRLARFGLEAFEDYEQYQTD